MGVKLLTIIRNEAVWVRVSKVRIVDHVIQRAHILERVRIIERLSHVVVLEHGSEDVVG